MATVFKGLALCLGLGMAAVPLTSAKAQIQISEATGNWAGPAGGGFSFRATLSHVEDEADLRIWNGLDTIPDGSGSPDLTVKGFASVAFATSQRLEPVASADGTLLQLVSEYADEEGEGREVVQLQFIDNQFTLVGYYADFTLRPAGTSETATIACEIDFRSGTVREAGAERSLPPLQPEDLNASSWHIGAAYDRGWCLN